MKKIIIFLYAICLFYNSNYAQTTYNSDAKRDNIWEIGYAGYFGQVVPNPNPIWGINHLSFNASAPVQIRKGSNIYEYSNSAASICDTAGRFLFSTNGIFLYDTLGNIMQGSNFICSGVWIDNFLDSGYPGRDACMILPAPGHPNLYYNFQICMFDALTPPYWGQHLNYNIIDMNGNNGLGAVTQQSQSIIANDTLDTGKISACRHANGRDWWIFVWRGSERTTNACAKILLDPQGLHFQGWHNYGSSPQPGAGQTLFTPDGTKHIRYYPYGWHTVADNCLDIFDFDRCTGEMTNYRPIRYMDSVYSAGAAVSPNSRYLYTSVHNRVYQFDLQAPDILTSKITVATYDGFSETGDVTGQTYFNTMRLAPDGKIYIGCTNGVHYLHVIENPDVRGVGCNLRQHGLQLLTFNSFAMPNFPYFRLGAQVGSGCDTLNVGTQLPTASGLQVKIFPNPAKGYTRIEWAEVQQKPIKIEIINSIGQVLETMKVQNSAIYEDINTQNMPNGVYFIKLSTTENQNYTARLIKISD
jgi:Secretion system C-terminal sorting domain